MKNLFKITMGLVALCVTSTANAQNIGETTLQDEGKMVFRALTSIYSYSDFTKYFMWADDYRKLARIVSDRDVSEQFYQLAELFDQGEVDNNRLWREWNHMMETGRVCGVDWGKVEYVDWKYTGKNIAGVEGGIGALIFKCNGQYFSTHTFMLKVGNTYKILLWGNSTYKTMLLVFSDNLSTSYQKGNYCIGDQCWNIAPILEETELFLF
jgi:hypothetical protein